MLEYPISKSLRNNNSTTAVTFTPENRISQP